MKSGYSQAYNRLFASNSDFLTSRTVDTGAFRRDVDPGEIQLDYLIEKEDWPEKAPAFSGQPASPGEWVSDDDPIPGDPEKSAPGQPAGYAITLQRVQSQPGIGLNITPVYFDADIPF